MKKTGLILLVLVVAIAAAVVMAQPAPAWAGGHGHWNWNTSDAEIARHNAMHGRQNWPNGYYYPNGNYYPNGYHCDGYRDSRCDCPPRIYWGISIGGVTIGGWN